MFSEAVYVVFWDWNCSISTSFIRCTGILLSEDKQVINLLVQIFVLYRLQRETA